VNNQYRPDGSPIKLVPTRYIRKMDDPTKITSDVVGSMIAYFHMAENFRNMTEVQDDLESILELLSQQTIENDEVHRAAGTTYIYAKAK
jgi:hypothetical protein